MTAKALPVVYFPLVGDCYVDFRLQELRPVDEPHKAYPFIYLCDEELKKQLRGLRAEFSSALYYMMGLDD